MTLEARVSCFDTNLTRRTHPQHAESNKNKQLLRNSQKWESFSELLALKSAACAQKKASRSSHPDLPDLPDLPKTQHPAQNRPWVPHAGGQDDGSLHKLPQITTHLGF